MAPGGPLTCTENGSTVACEARDGALLVVPLHDGAAELERAVRLSGNGRRLYELRSAGAPAAGWIEALVQAGATPEEARRDAERFGHELREAGLGGGDPAGERGPGQDGAIDRPGEGEAAPVPGEDMVALARAVLAAGKRVRFVARGHSMRPWIADGSMLEAAPRPVAQVRSGEVVLYAVEGRLVAHRALGRRGGALLARGDSAARVDVVEADACLGVVETCARPGGAPARPSSGLRRLGGRVTGGLHAVLAAVVRVVVVRPLRATYGSPSPVRAGLRGLLRVAGALLRLVERASQRLNDPLDRARAALLSTAEKDEERRRLYERRTTQEFTSLDENLAAGLTPLEELVLARHPVLGRALVLGCGPGRECIELARRGAQVTGIDREPGMLERARELARSAGLGVSYVEGEAVDFRLAGPPFEAVVVFSGLYNMVLPRARRVALLARAREHLVSGGRVLVTFLSAYVPPPGAKARARPLGEGLLGALSPDHEEGDRYLLNEAIHVFPSAADLAAEARDAGLGVLDLFRDQRAYDRYEGRVRGYAVLVRSDGGDTPSWGADCGSKGSSGARPASDPVERPPDHHPRA